MREPHAAVFGPPFAGVIRSAVRHRVTPGGKPRAISYVRFGGNAYDAAHSANELVVKRGIIVSGFSG